MHSRLFLPPRVLALWGQNPAWRGNHRTNSLKRKGKPMFKSTVSVFAKINFVVLGIKLLNCV